MARATDRPVPSSPGRARTTTTPPADAGGPAWEPPDGLWGTSTSTSAMTQASSANALDFFSSLLIRASRPEAVRLPRLVRLTCLTLNWSLGLSDFFECKGQRGHNHVKVFTPAKTRYVRRSVLLQRLRGLVQQLCPGTDIRLSFDPGAFTGH